MNNINTTTPATVGDLSAHVAALKAHSKKQATARNHAPKTRKPAKGVNAKKNATNSVQQGSKSAKVLELLGRTNGVSLAELMKATKWQAHSVRGFLSTASRKRGVRMESLKNGKGERIYRVKK